MNEIEKKIRILTHKLAKLIQNMQLYKRQKWSVFYII